MDHFTLQSLFLPPLFSDLHLIFTFKGVLNLKPRGRESSIALLKSEAERQRVINYFAWKPLSREELLRIRHVVTLKLYFHIKITLQMEFESIEHVGGSRLTAGS